MLRSGKPRHEQISDWLREQIGSGTYEADQQLPSESQLGERFSVSRITVRRSLQTLESEGAIYRRQGLGSFVKGTTVEQGLVRLTDFVEDMRQAGLDASSEVKSIQREHAESEVANALAIEPGLQVVRLDRLRLGNGEPIAFDQTWLPHTYWQYIDGHDLANRTIYGILEQDYGILVRSGVFRISAVDAPTTIAAYLHIPKRRAVLLIERTSIAESNHRVYYQRRYYRSDRVAYQLELNRGSEPAGKSTAAMPLQDFEPVFSNR